MAEKNLPRMNAAACKEKLATCEKNCPTPDQAAKLTTLAGTLPDPSTFITNLMVLLEKDGPGAATLVTELLTLFGL